jgi:hypothetical protein
MPEIVQCVFHLATDARVLARFTGKSPGVRYQHFKCGAAGIYGASPRGTVVALLCSVVLIKLSPAA